MLAFVAFRQIQLWRYPALTPYDGPVLPLRPGEVVAPLPPPPVVPDVLPEALIVLLVWPALLGLRWITAGRLSLGPSLPPAPPHG